VLSRSDRPLFAGALLFALSLSLRACTAHAQPVEPAWCVVSSDDVHALAFAAFHEAGDSVADSAALHGVLRALAEGSPTPRSFPAMAARYMPRAFAGATSRSAWARVLGPWCVLEPDGYPSAQRRWASTELEWFRAWSAAERVLAGGHQLRCDGTIHDWGSPAVDRCRAERLGLIPVRCTVDGRLPLNDFYARPSWRRRGA
jgi:hypothetical protein